jgi:hypothetical protein
MVLDPVDLPTSGFTRSFAFSLATGLAWLGHDRPCDCPRMATELPARVWFMRLPLLPDGRPATWTGTLVVVELGKHSWPARQVRGLLREVNHCTKHDNIRVRERNSTDHGSSWADPE